MMRVLEILCTILVIGAVGILKFGMPDDLPWASEEEEVVDPQAAFDRRWGKQPVRQEVGVYYKNCSAARAAGAAPSGLASRATA